VSVKGPSALAERASVFGIHSFRPGQRELIDAIIQGRDALGILPTGGGKSHISAAFSFVPKLVVVVTPLISLAEDQTDKLELRRVPAIRLDSTLTAAEHREALNDVQGGGLELRQLVLDPVMIDEADEDELIAGARRPVASALAAS
jgi:ATP-dependent DNA helicase RecQ